MKILAILLLCVGVAFYRSPSIPEVPDTAFGAVQSVPANAVSVESFSGLSEAFRKESAVFESIQSDVASDIGYKWLAIKFTPEQSASVGRLAGEAAKARIHLLPIKGEREFGTGARLYSEVAKVFAYQFVIRIRAGDVAGARSAYSQFAAFRRNLVSASDVGMVEFVTILTADAIFTNLSNEIAASPWNGLFSADIKRALVSKSIAQTGLYQRALRKYATDASESALAGVRDKGNPLLSFFYDEAFVAAYYRKFSSFNLPATNTKDVREFYDSLPYCPMGEAAASENETDKGVLIKKAHYKLTCPFDPLRARMFPRFLLANGYVGFDYEGDVSNLEKVRNETLTFIANVPKPVK